MAHVLLDVCQRDLHDMTSYTLCRLYQNTRISDALIWFEQPWDLIISYRLQDMADIF